MNVAEASTVYIARQAIFDVNKKVVAYELLYRNSGENFATVTDASLATARVVTNALLEMGLARLTAGTPAFINVPGEFLVAQGHTVLPSDAVVLELLESEIPNEDVRRAIVELRRDGYRVALDDFAPGDARTEVLDIADIVKVDVRATPREALPSLHRELRARGVTTLAEKVESHREFERLRNLGFEFFQGFFFERPVVISRSTLQPEALTMVKLFTELSRPDVEFNEVTRLIQSDVGLSHRMLKLVNSAAYGLSSRVSSLKEAVVYLGLNSVRNIVVLLSLAQIAGKPAELSITALVRARMCEALAAEAALSRDSAFTVGLLSVLDAFYDVPLQLLVDELPLTADVSRALVAHEGALGGILDTTIAFQRGRWSETALRGLPGDNALRDAYLDAVRWTEEVRRELRLAH